MSAEQRVHWTEFGVGSDVFEPYGQVNGRLEWSVSSELARGQDGRLLPLYGRRHWPTLINLVYEEEHGWGESVHTVSAKLFTAGLTADLARVLAAMLVQAADMADGIDKPCCAPCGHWAPCDACEVTG